MTLRMLINAQHREECRIAVADDDLLLELEVERADQIQLKGNIYKAPITRIEPSLQAAFLDIGSNRNGFLQINDINSTYFNNWPPDESAGRLTRPPIQDVLRSGQELVVQVVKDERAAKGATLTTNLSMPGRYLVLMVGNQRGGVSRKIVDEGQRSRLRGAVRDLRIPPGMGVIVRTAGINKSTTQLQSDLDSLLETWFDIVERAQQPGGPVLLYKESDLATRTIRDYLTSDIDEILIDDQITYESALQFVRRAIPAYENRIKFYDQPQPLFSAYHLDAQIDQTDSHEVTLPSGGSIVINTTEAVVAVDVNSGRSTGQSDVEETAFATNKEAAVAIAKQLRLRDLGGLVVIDFIDMSDRRHKQTVERVLRDAVSNDKAKVEIGRISKFGLLEMSRQRLKSSLVSQSHSVCSHCQGRGRVKNAESAALEALRKIQSAAFAGGVEHIRIHMSPVAALLLLNEKRHILTDFENRSRTKISIYADGRLKPEEYKLELITERHGSEGPTRSEVSRLRSNETPRNAENDRQSNDPEGNRRRGRGRQNNPRNNRGGNNNRSRGRRRNNGGQRDQQNRPRQGGESGGSAPVEGGSSENRESTPTPRPPRPVDTPTS
jgi:ribonuclease E